MLENALKDDRDLEQQLLGQRIDLFFRQSALPILMLIPYGLLLIALLHNDIPTISLWVWFTAIVIVVIFRTIQLNRYHKYGKKFFTAKQWATLHVLTTGLISGVIGTLGLFAIYPLTELQLSFITVSLIAIAGVSLTINYSYMPALLASLVPIFLPFIAAQLFVNQNSGIIFSLAAALYFLVLLNASRTMSQHAVKNIRLDINNRGLIDELQKVNQSLIEAKDQSERSNKAKSDFISHISHELRTPLNAILGYSELLSMDENITEKQRVDIGHIYNSGEHLLQLINEILDLSRIESGRIDIQLQDFMLYDVIVECQMMMQHMAARRNLQLEFTWLIDATINVNADPMRLKQVLINLISNAIKYTHEEDTIIVETMISAEGHVQINIIDHGPGIVQEVQDNLFEPFNRAGAEKTTIQGSGMGLAIAKQYMQHMGGDIGVVSQPGKGAKFWLTLKPSINAASIEQPAYTYGT